MKNLDFMCVWWNSPPNTSTALTLALPFSLNTAFFSSLPFSSLTPLSSSSQLRVLFVPMILRARKGYFLLDCLSKGPPMIPYLCRPFLLWVCLRERSCQGGNERPLTFALFCGVTLHLFKVPRTYNWCLHFGNQGESSKCFCFDVVWRKYMYFHSYLPGTATTET